MTFYERKLNFRWIDYTPAWRESPKPHARIYMIVKDKTHHTYFKVKGYCVYENGDEDYCVYYDENRNTIEYDGPGEDEGLEVEVWRYDSPWYCRLIKRIVYLWSLMWGKSCQL